MSYLPEGVEGAYSETPMQQSATGLRAKLLQKAWFFGVGEESLDPQLRAGRIALGPLRLRWTFRRHARGVGTLTTRRSLRDKLDRSG